jgi:hypothetical protein
MAYLPKKVPPPTDSSAVALGVMDDLDAQMPIVPPPQNYNGPYPQTIDIERAYQYEGNTRQVLSDQYVRAARFYGTDNSAARTACYTQNHSNSELVARWCMMYGATPITAEYLGITPAPPTPPMPPTPTPLEEVYAAQSAANAAMVTLNQAIAKL